MASFVVVGVLVHDLFDICDVFESEELDESLSDDDDELDDDDDEFKTAIKNIKEKKKNGQTCKNFMKTINIPELLSSWKMASDATLF